MTRITARIFDRYPHAWDLNEVLRKGGIDSKIVSKHAVQIHPEHVSRAIEVCREERVRRAAAEKEKQEVA